MSVALRDAARAVSFYLHITDLGFKLIVTHHEGANNTAAPRLVNAIRCALSVMLLLAAERVLL